MKRKGFTLIELLLVIGIIAILASIVIVAINPTKQLADARNAKRQSDVQTILDAVYQYAIDENNIPDTITTTATDICQTGGDCTTPDPDYIDLTVLTTNGKYLVEIPKDPQTLSSETNTTNYQIIKDANGRVTVSAPDAEDDSISVTR